VTLLLQSQESKTAKNTKPIRSMFSKIQDNPDLQRGIEYFLRKVVRQTDVAGDADAQQQVIWGCKIAIEELKEHSRIT
jgi:nucleolar MIF4G domain-containing protein 1